MTRKRAGSFSALLLLLAVVLAACGGAPAAPAATTAPAAPEATAAPAATAAPVATFAPVAAQPTVAPAPTAEPAAAGDATKPLPPDAAPPEYQVFVGYYDNTATYSTSKFLESVYNEGGFGAINSLLGEPLVRLNKDIELQPAAALKWTPNADATEWTFELDPNLIWSDGTPLTADDYVTTFRYAADPKHAWDFAWYYSAPGAIKNWDKVVAGEVPPDQLGVKADGPNKLIFQTETPAPFLPAKLIYSEPFQKAAFEKYGALYDNDPKTSVSSGPFILTEWNPRERIVYEANPMYKGSNKPYLRKVIAIAAKPETFFAGYQTNEVDYVHNQALQTADMEIINSDPELSKQLHTHTGDFRTDYLYFDVQNPPFNDIKVRQAISHVIDRDSLIKNILGEKQAIPAYSFLMPGFPASNSQGLKDIQNYDPDKARALLAEAGFPGGKGFPKLTLWLRNENQLRQSLAQAIAASIKQELGIEVEVANKDFDTYMEALNAKPTQIQFGMVSYGIDFVDPSNMLGVWLTGGRHNWNNKTFDKLVSDAAASPDQEGRIKQFMEAEKLMVEEVPAVWLVHRTQTDLLKPWVKGTELEPNKAGFAAMQWPNFSAFATGPGSMYIGKEVLEARSEPPK